MLDVPATRRTSRKLKTSRPETDLGGVAGRGGGIDGHAPRRLRGSERCAAVLGGGCSRGRRWSSVGPERWLRGEDRCAEVPPSTVQDVSLRTRSLEPRGSVDGLHKVLAAAEVGHVPRAEVMRQSQVVLGEQLDPAGVRDALAVQVTSVGI